MSKKNILISGLKPFGVDISGLDSNTVVERKQFLPSIKMLEEEESTVICSMSTDTVDADGDMVYAPGCNLERYQKNPIVCWSHNYAIPSIGKTLEIQVTGGAVVGKVKYAPTTMGQEIFTLVKGGFLRTCSVGFITDEAFPSGSAGYKSFCKEFKLNPPANTKRLITKWTLLENSMVNIPSNPDALVHAVSSKSIKLDDKLARELGLEVKEIKPIGPFADFDACMVHMTDVEGYDEETAQKICGKMEAEKNGDTIGDPPATESPATVISRPANPQEAVQLAINDAVNLLTASGYQVTMIPPKVDSLIVEPREAPISNVITPEVPVLTEAVPNPRPSGTSSGDNGTQIAAVIQSGSEPLKTELPDNTEESLKPVEKPKPNYVVVRVGECSITLEMQKTIEDEAKKEIQEELKLVSKGKIL